MEKEKKIKVGMVQINNSFDRQDYLPLSLGFLHSYAKAHAKNFNDFEFSSPIYKRISIKKAVEHLSDSDIACFSTYVWNFEISKAIARGIKEENPNAIILFGGCHVPDTREKGLEALLRKYPFVDFASPGEGERPFKSFLENYPGRNWEAVPSLAFLDEKKRFVYTNEGLSMQDLLNKYKEYLKKIYSAEYLEEQSPEDLKKLYVTHVKNLSTDEFLKKRRELDPIIESLKKQRVEDLNTIPSPYLTGYFDELIKSNPDQQWNALFETNRGCPFECSFCDWGIASTKRMADYDLENRIFKEIDWFSRNKIEFVYCCDANFGLYKERDLAIAKHFAENKKEYGYPHRFSVQNTKNSTEVSYRIQEVLNDSGLDKGVLLAFQSLHEPTLKAVKRGNIKLSTYHELQKRFTREGVTTFSDIILGLPLETYETFTNGVSTLIENGQHNRIQFNNLSILPNAPMVEDIEKYGLEIVESDMINIHGSLGEWADNIYEKQQLVVGTSTMPREDWVKARNFGYMLAFLHFDKLLQLPNILLNTQYGISYKEIADTFIENPRKTPVIEEISNLFSGHARNLQNGGAEYIHSKEYLNIWWPADEYALIKLATEGKLDAFYREAQGNLEYLLERKGYKGDSDRYAVLGEAIYFNKELLKMPFNDQYKKITLNYNILDIYKRGLLAEKVPIETGEFLYIIDKKAQIDRDARTSNENFKIINSWNSWEDWCREVVWWGNKKGAYLYSCIPIKEGQLAQKEI